MIEQSLRESADVWFPETPSFAQVVAPRLPVLPDAPRPRRARRALVIALALLLLAGTAVAATQFDLVPGVRIHRVESLPTTSYTEPPFGREMSLAEGSATVPFTILLPESLGDPDRLLLDRDQGGAPVVTAVYGGTDGARLVLTQWSAQSILFEKMLGYDVTAEYVDVGGASGIWMEGDEHAVFYRGRHVRDERIGGYLTGSVLVWQRGPMSYRLEAAVPQARALEFAASMRPSR